MDRLISGWMPMMAEDEAHFQKESRKHVNENEDTKQDRCDL